MARNAEEGLRHSALEEEEEEEEELTECKKDSAEVQYGTYFAVRQ